MRNMDQEQNKNEKSLEKCMDPTMIPPLTNITLEPTPESKRCTMIAIYLKRSTTEMGSSSTKIT